MAAALDLSQQEAAAVLGLLAGCESGGSEDRNQAAERYMKARSTMALQLAERQFDSQDLDSAEKTLNDALKVNGIRGASRADAAAIDQALPAVTSVSDALISLNGLYISDPTASVTIGGTRGVDNFTWYEVQRTAGTSLSANAQLMGILLQYPTTNSPAVVW